MTTLPNKNLIIRSDADTKIGTGHVMRCIALAQAWQEQGGNVTFLSHCDSEALRQRIIDEGFDFVPIEKPHPDPSDLTQTLNILKRHAPCLPRGTRRPFHWGSMLHALWFVVDGYHFTPDYQKVIRENGYRLLVIDDMAHLDHYHANILLNQNIHASSLHYSSDRDTVKLLGCEYILLRREFLKYKDWKREIPQKAKKIVVTLGGADPDNVTLKVINALHILNEPNIEVKIVVGTSNPHLPELRDAVRHVYPVESLPNGIRSPFHRDEGHSTGSPCTMRLVQNVKGMPGVMAWADIAITAGGSTCWEIAYMGLPNCTIVLADNQVPVAEILQKISISVNLGWFRSIDPTNLAQIIGRLVQDCRRRESMSVRGKSVITGRGSQNVVRAMSEH